MAENTALARVQSVHIAAAKRIDQIVSEAMVLLREPGSFAAELAVAQSIGDMRAALTPAVMAPVMELMNTDLGFRTDRGPGNTKNPTPYAVEIVRDCLIEAKLRGFHAVGNEFNIISGRFYAAKNGLRRKVTTWPGVVDFKDGYDVPRLAGGGAIVKCRATWKKEGTSDSLECEIPVKTNEHMGADAILGKAERKLLKRVHDRLSGISTPDGDAEDSAAGVVVEERAVAPPQPTPPPAKPTTTQTSGTPARADGPSPLGQAALEHGEAQSRGRREPPVTDSRGAEFFGPSPEPKTSEQAPAATGELAAATKPELAKEPPQVEHPSQLVPETATSIIARLNETERFSQVKELDARARALGVVPYNEVVDIYIAAVIRSFEAAEDKAELGKITTEIGRLRKDNWLTKAQTAKAELERSLAAKRLGG